MKKTMLLVTDRPRRPDDIPEDALLNYHGSTDTHYIVSHYGSRKRVELHKKHGTPLTVELKDTFVMFGVRFICEEYRPRYNAQIEKEAKPMNKQYEEHAVTELCLYIENTGEIYERLTKPTVHNLAKHYAKGQFDKEKALISMKRLADEGAKAYLKEYGRLEDYQKVFTPADRTEAAARLLDSLMEHIDGTNPL